MKKIKTISLITTMVNLIDMIIFIVLTGLTGWLAFGFGDAASYFFGDMEDNGSIDAIGGYIAVGDGLGGLISVFGALLFFGAMVLSIILTVHYLIAIIFGFSAVRKAKDASGFMADCIVKLICNFLPVVAYVYMFLSDIKEWGMLVWVLPQVAVIVLTILNINFISIEKKRASGNVVMQQNGQ